MVVSTDQQKTGFYRLKNIQSNPKEKTILMLDSGGKRDVQIFSIPDADR